MPKEIKCPDCGSYNINQVKAYKAVRPRKPYDDLQEPTEEYIKYECLDCGLEFYEANLKE